MLRSISKQSVRLSGIFFPTFMRSLELCGVYSTLVVRGQPRPASYVAIRGTRMDIAACCREQALKFV